MLTFDKVRTKEEQYEAKERRKMKDGGKKTIGGEWGRENGG